MNITPYPGNDSGQAKDVLTRGVRMLLGDIKGAGYSCFISRVNDGPGSQNSGTIIFVHNVDPETLLEEGK